MSKKKKDTASVPTENTAVYVYLGPSIRGVIQYGSIYTGTKTEITERLKSATDRYPLISRLLIEDVRVAEVRKLINEGTNSYSIAYKELAK